jgi:hypothetical protein
MKNASQTVLDIAKLMYSPGDQLSLFVTCPTNSYDLGLSKSQSNYEVIPFIPPNCHKLRNELQTLKVGRSSPDCISNLEASVIQASDRLIRLNHSPVLHIRTASRTIILVSARPDDVVHRIPDLDDGITIHCISPTVIPCEADIGSSLGWFMNQPWNKDFQHRKSSKDENDDLIKKLLVASRFQTPMGKLYNLQISLQLSQDVSLLHRNGDLRLLNLLPGQHHTVVLHLQVDSIRNGNKGYQPSRIDSNIALARAFSEVEETLDTRLRELLTVQISYKNSHFPENTTMEAKEVLWIRRPNSRRSLEAYEEPYHDSLNRVTVHEAVALKFASRRDYNSALQWLLRKVREFNLPKEFSEPLRQELIFQSNTQDIDCRLRQFDEVPADSYGESKLPRRITTREHQVRSEAYQRLTGQPPSDALQYMRRTRPEDSEEDDNDSIWRSYVEGTPPALSDSYGSAHSGVNRYASPA